MNKTTNKAETCYDDDGLAAALITESMVGLLSNGFLMTLLISPKTKINNLIKVQLGMTEVCPLGVSWVSPHPTEFVRHMYQRGDRKGVIFHCTHIHTP